MVSIDTGYDDGKALEGGEGGEGRDFALSFGEFDAEIVDISPPKKDATEFEVKKATNGKPHYSARYTFEYKDSKGKEKMKSAFISCIGLWFTPLLKQLLIATESNNAEDRTAMMNDTNHLKGKKVRIVVGARLKEYGDRKEFQGFEVGEYDGKCFIANEIVQIVEKGGKTDFDEDAEKTLRLKFKEANKSGGSDAKSEKPVDESFGKDYPANF